MNSIKALFSPDKRAARIEARLQRAISAGDPARVASSYRQSFSLLLKEDQPHLLSNLVLTYGSQVEAIAPLTSLLPAASLRQAIGLLERHRLDASALAICDYGGFGAEAVEILAKRGRADELAAWMTKDRAVDKELLRAAVADWERYNGDIRTDPTMGHVLTSIARFAPGSLPALPRVKEIVGQMEEAAVLYVKAEDLANAARCYEGAGRYGEALKLYERLGDTERASQAAEAMGDVQEALRLVVSPKRKFRLLLQMERFLEAREFAAGLEDPDRNLGLVEERARERMEVKAKSHDFVGAMELADPAGCEAADRERILALGRQHFDRKLALAASEEEIRSIFRDRVKLEEAAGCFEEAGRLADEILGDLDLASRLYEKAYLFDKAIGTASGIIRRAELHVKGGNQLKAAELYELAQEYDKAYALYEGAQQYGKAVECYLRTAHLEPEVLIRLYTGAGEFEKATDVYMQAGGFSDLEKALAMATAHGLASHVRVIRERMEALISGGEGDLARFFEQAKAEIVGAYSPVIGIDFGTSNSVAALFNKRGAKPEIVPNARGLTHEPSFFGADEDGHLIFGEAARLRGLTAPDCAVARVKRSLGERAGFSVRGKQYSCEQIVGAFLQHLRSNAAAYVQSKVEARLSELLESGEVRLPTGTVRAFLDQQAGYVHFDDVVLCVPAYFNDNQKRATRDSAEIAGLRVRRLLHEPTAAALAYGHQKPYSGKLAVIDLGGGTLDISILEIGEGVHDVVTVGGNTRLGGSDIDALLVERVVQDIKERWGIQLDAANHRAELNRLRDDCENLKISLSSISQYTMELAHFLGRPHYTFALTRTELKRLSQPILDRIQTTIADTVKGHGAGIDGFILVGSATKMPAVADLARRTMHVKELHGIDPATVVATGAALEGAILSGDLAQTLLLDIVPYSLGIVVSSDADVERIDRLIDKDTTIPTHQSGVYTTKKDNQPNVHIRIYQGESPQPDKNHFLGNFIFDGIPPAPAHTPEIEVTFDIGADCILTVTAVDKATGNKRSIRVEGSVLLSPQEKQTLSDYFTQREKSQSLEKELEALRLEINTLCSSCEERIRSTEQAIDAFLVQFHEKVEAHPELYTARPDQIGAIQAMIIEQERFRHGIPTYRDQLASTVGNLHQIEAKHLDFSKPDIAAKLRERMEALSYGRQALVDLIKSVEGNVVEVVSGWTQLLASMQPDWAKMDPIKAAKYHLVAGGAGKAREILESLASGDEGLSREAFWLLLSCQAALGLRNEFRDTHARFGRLFGLVYPDFSHLDAYLKAVDASVFMIQGQAGQQGVSGSGFCVGPGLVVTNRHVVEGMALPHIRVIGKEATYAVVGWELDPIHDIALLRVNGVLKPLRMGESCFVEPGESILAIGFPSPSSAVHGENIYISKGVVNSIRRTEISPERVIFIDAKIGQGMSGGPLINDLGEVVGVVTLVRYAGRQSEHGMVYLEDQPVALPVHLVKKHVMSIQ